MREIFSETFDETSGEEVKRFQGMPSKMDSILEEPEVERVDDSELRSKRTDRYEVAVGAMKSVELYFEQYVDGSSLNAALTLATRAVEAINPKREIIVVEELNGAEAAIGMLRTRLLDDQSRVWGTNTNEMQEIIQECLKDLDLVEEVLETSC